MLIHWIWLATRPDMGDRMKLAVLEAFRDPEEIFYAEQNSYSNVPGITQAGMEALADKDLSAAREILDSCVELNIGLCTYNDGAYPARLKNIANPPVLLYYKGKLAGLDSSPVIGVVGTRKASAYGITTAKKMGYQIAKCGGILVSGLAEGIDGNAMAGALTAGGMVVGILGCGVDVIYPAMHKSLYRDTENNGCLISEFPPKTPPYKWNFPKRNRLISGLSNGVLVVEAPHGSGSLITARQAADQGRDVFVVPGNIDVDTFKGSNALLRDGAIAVSSGWDVLSEYAAQFPDKIHRDSTKSRQTAYPDEVVKATQDSALKVAQKPKKPAAQPEKTKKEIDKTEPCQYSDAERKRPTLQGDEAKIVALLEQGQELVDDIIAETGMPAGAVLAVLTMLEVKGVIQRLPGKRVKLK